MLPSAVKMHREKVALQEDTSLICSWKTQLNWGSVHTSVSSSGRRSGQEVGHERSGQVSSASLEANVSHLELWGHRCSIEEKSKQMPRSASLSSLRCECTESQEQTDEETKLTFITVLIRLCHSYSFVSLLLSLIFWQLSDCMVLACAAVNGAGWDWWMLVELMKCTHGFVYVYHLRVIMLNVPFEYYINS